MYSGMRRFHWYWLLEHMPLASIAWMLMVISFCLLFCVWPPLSFAALLLLFIVYKVVQFRGARFLENLGTQRVTPSRWFLVFWRCVFYTETAIVVILLVLQTWREGWAYWW
jgi:hypothetical protein